MIVYDLACSAGHVFEGWFANAADYDRQKEAGLLTCPVCDSREVTKQPQAPAVPRKGNRHPLAALRAEIESQCDDVGPRFPEEARARHAAAQRGETVRGAYGEASLAEVRALVDEGIPVAPLPFRPRRLADA
ncbi:DUF1178 family protein [Thermaurantiacus sp.]